MAVVNLTKEQITKIEKVYGKATVEMIQEAPNYNSLNISKDDINEISGMELQNSIEDIPRVTLKDAVKEHDDPAVEMLEYSLHERDLQFLRSRDYSKSSDKIRAEVIAYCRENGVDYKAMTALAEDYRQEYLNSAEYERDKEEERKREEEEKEEENNPWIPGFGQYY